MLRLSHNFDSNVIEAESPIVILYGTICTERFAERDSESHHYEALLWAGSSTMI